MRTVRGIGGRRGENKALESERSEAVGERAGAELRAAEGRRGAGEGKGVYREIGQVKRPVLPLFCPVSCQSETVRPTTSQMDTE